MNIIKLPPGKPSHLWSEGHKFPVKGHPGNTRPNLKKR